MNGKTCLDLNIRPRKLNTKVNFLSFTKKNFFFFNGNLFLFNYVGLIHI
jgi:hypothetical protein